MTYDPTAPIGPLGPWMPERCEDLIIRPKAADLILEWHNTHNRNMIPHRIDKITQDILAGKWGDPNGKSNGETIIFCLDGTLLDGQNRLAACKKAQKAIKSLVAFGRSKESFFTIDRGTSRSVPSDLQIAGELNAHSLAAVLQIVASYQRGTRSSALVNSLYDSREILEVLANNPGIRESVSWVSSNSSKIAAPPRVVGAVHYLAGMTSNPRVLAARDEFFARTADGLHLSERDPIYVLRCKLDTMENNPEARVKKGMGRLTAFTHLHAFVKCWNAHLLNRSMSKVQLTYVDRERLQLADIPDIRVSFRRASGADDMGIDTLELT